ncbi:AcrR family transcriptional regulator [Neobacillus niacini]|uniref:TetR/AcrR family transcriptional regulator n=1 Tax=Neobacillus niacini TaxID=86668 RepID=UPI002783484C|nr:TetR/AcrR family transcriptional regulator [Neobacillus niacini]MDQ1002263.1 AcrR family transcriptional regulator [Neobacillus niacini]
MKMSRSQKTTKPDRRRTLNQDQIKICAMEVFSEIGYMKATVKDITTRANVGHGTFYHYFKNKNDLLDQLVDDLFEKVNQDVQPKTLSESLYETMKDEAGTILDFYNQNRGVLLALKEAMMVDQHYKDKWLKISERLFKRIERDIKGSMKKGYCHNMNIDITIRALACMFEGYGHHLMLQPASPRETQITAESLTDFCYKAVFKLEA